jgi:hypothetical protein
MLNLNVDEMIRERSYHLVYRRCCYCIHTINAKRNHPVVCDVLITIFHKMTSLTCRSCFVGCLLQCIFCTNIMMMAQSEIVNVNIVLVRQQQTFHQFLSTHWSLQPQEMKFFLSILWTISFFGPVFEMFHLFF